MAMERGSVESHEDAAHRALHHQHTLLGVALLRNIHKRNSFSPKRAIGSSNYLERPQPEGAHLTWAEIE